EGDRHLGAAWARWQALGWPALLVPEAHGGLGLGLVDAVVVLEEHGRVTMPGPFLSSAVAATLAASRLGCADLLAGLASGTTRRVSRMELVAHPARAVGPDGDHTGIWRRVVDDVGVALSAELVGVCDAALAMAIAYANDRVQFDVPIASHQVIQHKIVDMLHQ